MSRQLLKLILKRLAVLVLAGEEEAAQELAHEVLALTRAHTAN